MVSRSLIFFAWSMAANIVAMSHAQDGNTYPPYQYTVFRGAALDSSLTDFLFSDDDRARFNPGYLISSQELPIWLFFDGVVVPESVDLLVESNANTPGIIRYVAVFNYHNNWYDDIASHAESYEIDSVVLYPMSSDAHVGFGGTVSARVGWRNIGFSLVNPWEIRIDQVVWIGSM